MTDVVLTVHDWTPGPFEMPVGHTEFVVGDAHGCARQLSALLDAGRDMAPDAFLALLGDVADRGPDSLGCLKLGGAAVREYRAHRGGAMYLPGNHEQMLVNFLANPTARTAEALRDNGGAWAWDTGLDGLPEAIMAALGAETCAVLTQNGLLLANSPQAVQHRRIGNTILVHAGIDPTCADPDAWINSINPLYVPKDEKTPLWIRKPFLNHKGAYPGNVVVVHGHTPEHLIVRHYQGKKAITSAPGQHVMCGSRLGLDGGSYATGFVSGALIRNGAYQVITAYA